VTGKILLPGVSADSDAQGVCLCRSGQAQADKACGKYLFHKAYPED